ncbi:peroxiredoxin [Enterovirga rhinocerotis]|uniref:thioredoxin-dependent peroxiredoxin n=1 Tax=Enterovirga rhinocerotis TaxID=1339210 RepID=A0A4R7BNK1_9HYPH|nr:peroxiredoxin [Enterovirga rhinocerotis]TDR85526.1 peroxiredoxin Q/BCP [Enterovirga rhinocerotis]
MTVASDSLEIGSAAPSFTLPDSAGRPVSLESLRGRTVVVFFYPKDDTSGCTAEAKDFTSLKGAFESAGAEIVGISIGSVAGKAKFARKHDLAITLAADEDQAVAEAYGVWVQKSMWGRKYMGIERATFLIDREGRIARVWRKVSVPGHAAEVLEAARAL